MHGKWSGGQMEKKLELDIMDAGHEQSNCMWCSTIQPTRHLLTLTSMSHRDIPFSIPLARRASHRLKIARSHFRPNHYKAIINRFTTSNTLMAGRLCFMKIPHFSMHPNRIHTQHSHPYPGLILFFSHLCGDLQFKREHTHKKKEFQLWFNKSQ